MKILGSVTDPKDIVTKEYVDGKISPYGTCSTAAATAAKTVTVDSDSFALETGVSVRVKFTNSNTVASPTLNVNGTGAKAIKRYGTTAVSTSAASSWNAGSILELTYDGTNWIINSFLNTTYSSMTVAEYEAGTGTTARTITPARLKAAILTWAPTDNGGINITKLWENASPSSSFAAQTVSVDLSGYDLVAVIGRTSTSNTRQSISITQVGFGGRIFHMQNGRDVREYSTSTTAVTFSTGYNGSVAANSSTANGSAIPVAIYGIKGVS